MTIIKWDITLRETITNAFAPWVGAGLAGSMLIWTADVLVL